MKPFNSLIVDKKGSKLTIFLLLVLHCCLGTKRPDFDFRVSSIIHVLVHQVVLITKSSCPDVFLQGHLGLKLIEQNRI